MTAPRAVLADDIRAREAALGETLDPLKSSPEHVARIKWETRERLLEGHRTPVWESLPEIVREEMVLRERLRARK